MSRSLRSVIWTFAGLAGIGAASIGWADVASGPAENTIPPAFKVHVVVGESADKDKEVDLVAIRDKKPTVYAFVPADKWGRPTARLLKVLDQGLKTTDDARLCAIWLTGDHNATHEYLPKAQTSLQFERTDLADFAGDAGGPPEWGINADADLTVVIVRDGKVVKTWGFVSPNDTVAKDVLDALKPK
jgi:hypothetical protein